MAEDPKDWIAVAALPELGPSTFSKLWQQGWTPERILTADVKQLREIGLRQKTVIALEQYRSSTQGFVHEQIDRALSWQQANADAHILAITHPDYPVLLREIYDPPLLLFVRGNLDALALPQLAIVGSRNASKSGAQHAAAFARFLNQSGFVIISGLAHGIDSAAHQAVVSNPGVTVAVFGTGPDKIYPARNRDLASMILQQNGAWVSEFFPGSQPLASHFPRRNRIISGMSVGVLVVEAALQSGSLITARVAKEQDREVFALPGAINNPMSKGCHRLIREGAHLVETGEDIVEHLSAILGHLSRQTATDIEAESPVAFDLSPAESSLLETMGFESIHLDQLVALTGQSVAELSSTLVALELKGLIEQRCGGYLRC